MATLIDTAVIGAGPIGIEAAIELRSRGLETRVFDAGLIGHTISWWAPQTRWFSSNDRIAIAGVPLHTVDQSKASREEYLNYLRGVVEQFDVDVSTFCRLVSIQPAGPRDEAHESGMWRLGFRRMPTAAGGLNVASAFEEPDFWVETRAVVLAIGGTDFPNRLGVPGEDLPHVDGYLREVHRYYGRQVLIVGGRNSAVEAAIRLHRSGAHVSLCYHREQLPTDGIKYWLRPEIEGLIRSGAIRAFFNSRVAEIMSDRVQIQTRGDGENSVSQIIVFDDVLTLIGYRQNTTLFDQLGILSDDESGSPVYDAATMQTPRSRIYVAGTAIGGTQSSKYQVFLENCHDHARKIADHLCGAHELSGRTSQLDDSSRHRVRGVEGCDSGLKQRIAWQPES